MQPLTAPGRVGMLQHPGGLGKRTDLENAGTRDPAPASGHRLVELPARETQARGPEDVTPPDFISSLVQRALAQCLQWPRPSRIHLTQLCRYLSRGPGPALCRQWERTALLRPAPSHSTCRR